MTLPDIDTIATYGGAKFDSGFVEDYTTDRSAACGNMAAATMAMATTLVVRAWVRMNVTGVIRPSDHMALWGNSDVVMPRVQVASSRIQIVWPSTVVDDLGVSHVVSFRAGWVSYSYTASTPTTIANTDVVSVSNNIVTIATSNTLATARRTLFLI